MLKNYSSYHLVESLRMIKFLYDNGLYDIALNNVTWISGDDFPEIFQNAMESLSPYYGMEEMGEEVCCGGHTLYHFGDPAIAEYYRLCRLYEQKYSVEPKNNPYIKKADDYYNKCWLYVSGNFGVSFNDEINPEELLIETCPEQCLNELELLEFVHNILEFLKKEAAALHTELFMRGVAVWLPALPAPKGGTANE